MNKKRAAKIATWIVVPLMALIFILDILTVFIGNKYSLKFSPTDISEFKEDCDDKIHFLNTGNSDCILLESNGHFALIDSGEGNNNPRKHSDYNGYEDTVISYLKKVASNQSGKIHLDFILGTHYHYDHIGNFDVIINNESVIIDKAYFKEFNFLINKPIEIKKWGLYDEAEKIKNSVINNNICLINKIPSEIDFYDFTLKLFNTGYYDSLYGNGENASSIGIKVIKGDKSAFLASDITGPSGLEKILGPEIGHSDLLKIGHHGYYGSSSMKFLDYLTPDVAIVTNIQGKVYPNVKWNLTMHAKVPFYGTYDYNGIIACFTDNNNIYLINNIH